MAIIRDDLVRKQMMFDAYMTMTLESFTRAKGLITDHMALGDARCLADSLEAGMRTLWREFHQFVDRVEAEAKTYHQVRLRRRDDEASEKSTEAIDGGQ